MRIDDEVESDFGYRLAEVATEPADGRLDRALGVLRELAEAPAAVLTRWEGPHRAAAALATHGYPAAVVRAVTAPHFHDRDPAYQRIRRDPGRPLRCWWDLDFDYGGSQLARELLVPGGFRGGVSLRLETRNGRYVGDLHMSTEDRRLPTPAAMHALNRARTVLAQLCLADARPHPPDFPRCPEDSDEEEVVLVAADGTVEVLAAGPDGEVAQAVLALAARSTGIFPLDGPAERIRRWVAPDGVWRRVRVRRSRTATVVSVRRERMPYGLTPRELDVLGMLGEGMSNFAISRRLRLSERTVAHCMERILNKLGAASRAQAAALSEREGLIVIR